VVIVNFNASWKISDLRNLGKGTILDLAEAVTPSHQKFYWRDKLQWFSTVLTVKYLKLPTLNLLPITKDLAKNNCLSNLKLQKWFSSVLTVKCLKLPTINLLPITKDLAKKINIILVVNMIMVF
jgi:hypothetical protein